MMFSRAVVSVFVVALIGSAAAMPKSTVDVKSMKRQQDWDPNGIICTADTDCTDPGYPYCRCASMQGTTTPGAPGGPTFVYACSSLCGADGCLPDCENCNTQACENSKLLRNYRRAVEDSTI